MAKKKLSLFVSYASRNGGLVDDLLERLGEQLRASRAFDFAVWRDRDRIPIGRGWDQQIRNALDECDAGLLLLSPAFLGSEYISSVELPALVDQAILPVLLKPISTSQVTHGLENSQIFAWRNGKGVRKSFDECQTTGHKNRFIEQLYEQVEARCCDLGGVS